MSGISYDVHCPNCGNEDAFGYTDWKPFDSTNIECFECGGYIMCGTNFGCTCDEVTE